MEEDNLANSLCPDCGQLTRSNGYESICGGCGLTRDIAVTGAANQEDGMGTQVLNDPRRTFRFMSILDDIAPYHRQDCSRVTAEQHRAIMCQLDWAGCRDRLDIGLRDVIAAVKKTPWSKELQGCTHALTAMYTGVPVPTLTPKDRRRLFILFQACVGPFNRVKPAARANPLNYQWQVYTLVHLCGLADGALHVYFAPLKGEDKNREHSAIWRDICADKRLRWRAYDTEEHETYRARQCLAAKGDPCRTSRTIGGCPTPST